MQTALILGISDAPFRAVLTYCFADLLEKQNPTYVSAPDLIHRGVQVAPNLDFCCIQVWPSANKDATTLHHQARWLCWPLYPSQLGQQADGEDGQA
jgi:hypothetical protein